MLANFQFPAPGRNAWPVVAAEVVLVLFGAWAYCNSFAAPFVFDDLPMIYENSALREFWPATSLGPRRQVAHISFALNRRWGGRAPWGYHVLNLAIHVAAGLALFGVARRTLQLPGIPARLVQSSTFLAFAVALLWLVHPLQTESVTYVIQRLESLAGLFYLLALYGVVRGARSHRPIIWYGCATLGCWAGMFTKETLVTAPLLVPLFDRCYLARSWRDVFRERGLLYAAWLPPLVYMLTSLAPEITGGEHASMGFGIPGFGPGRYLISQGPVLTHYLWLALFPERLCLDYAWPPALNVREVWPACAFILLLLTLSLAALWRWPRVGFLGVAFFGLLAPSSSIIPLADLAFEHRVYLALAPLMALAVLAARQVLRVLCSPRWCLFGADKSPAPAALRRAISRAWLTQRVLAVAALHLSSQALLVRTIERNAEYGNYISLWSATVSVAPHNGRAHVNLGGAYYFAQNYEQARAHLEKSLQLAPNPQAHTYLAFIALARGEWVLAEKHFHSALELDPKYARAHEGLGQLSRQTHDLPSAREHFRRAVEGDSRYTSAYLNLALVEIEMERAAAAAEYLETVLRMEPDSIAAAAELVWLRNASSDERVFNPPAAEPYLELLETAANGHLASSRVLEALAAARAARGNDVEARELVLRAADVAEGEGNQERGQRLRNVAKKYAQSEPVRWP